VAGKPQNSDTTANNPDQAGPIDERTFAAMTDAYGNYFKGLADINAEAYRFITDRLQQDIRLSTDIARCENADQALELQRTFCAKLVDDYTTETQRIIALMYNAADNRNSN